MMPIPALPTTNTRCTVYGQPGTVRYQVRDRFDRTAIWIGVQLDGEKRIDEYSPCQVEAAS